MRFFNGSNRRMMTSRLNAAPTFAPGGTVFHQGRITTNERTAPITVREGHQSCPEMSPNPAPTKQINAASHRRPKARPRGSRSVTVEERIHGRSKKPARFEVQELMNPEM
jgi:hypothetical protein